MFSQASAFDELRQQLDATVDQMELLQKAERAQNTALRKQLADQQRKPLGHCTAPEVAQREGLMSEASLDFSEVVTVKISDYTDQTPEMLSVHKSLLCAIPYFAAQLDGRFGPQVGLSLPEGCSRSSFSVLLRRVYFHQLCSGRSYDWLDYERDCEGNPAVLVQVPTFTINARSIDLLPTLCVGGKDLTDAPFA